MELLLPALFLILILFWGLFRTKIKGTIGEQKTAAILSLLNKSEYNVINNIVLKNGVRTTQIDHLVIADFGIFVIETKNYEGWILGGENSEYWTQSLYKYKNQFYNPIRQNLGHIRALKSILVGYPNLEYVSIIVFPSKADIKVKTSTEVIYTSSLLKTIKRHSDVNLTENDKERIYHKISSAISIDTYDKRQHIESVKRVIQEKESLLEENRCPRCGNELVVRKGKFGKFMGCKTYPNCRFTQNI